MTKKRILVTGASSPLGRAVGRHLQEGGYAALGTVRNQQKTANLGMFQEIYYLNLSNPFDEISLGESVDAIIHVAAESCGTPEQMMTVNTIGTYRLASAAIASGIPKFVYVSSTSVYGSTPTSELRSNSRIRSQSRDTMLQRCISHGLSEYFIFEQLIVSTRDDIDRLNELIKITRLLDDSRSQIQGLIDLMDHE